MEPEGRKELSLSNFDSVAKESGGNSSCLWRK